MEQSKLKGFLLADDMGLGKTISALTHLSLFASAAGPPPQTADCPETSPRELESSRYECLQKRETRTGFIIMRSYEAEGFSHERGNSKKTHQ